MPEQNENAEPESEREHTITRVFEVPARILFEAFSEPEHLLRWFGPKGFPLKECDVDFRIGGTFRFAMASAEGKLLPAFGGTYLAIEKNSVIRYSSALELPDAETMIVTVRFEEQNGKTTLTQHTLFASIAMKQKHFAMGYEVGVASGLEQLKEYAEGGARS